MKRPLTVTDLMKLLAEVPNPDSLVVYFEPSGNWEARVAIHSAYVSSRDIEPPLHADGSPNYECGEFIFAISDD